MNIQIFGIHKCFDTKKAQRFFKERNIKFQFIDLKIKGLSKGELESVASAVGFNELFNKKSKKYERLNLHKITTRSIREEILLENTELYKTPIVRNKKEATLGYKPEVWGSWIELQ